METSTIEVTLTNVTPMLGGGVHARQLDQTVDRVRIPTIRGHLRMWWRALYAHDRGFAEREAVVWGGTGHDSCRRSAVEIGVRAIGRQTPSTATTWPRTARRDMPCSRHGG